jgi:hypothetical protein
MTGADQIWKAKTDEQLAEASTQLMTYTGEGETVIRAELKRRGIPDPPPTRRSSAMPAAAAAAPGIRDRVAPVNFALACLTLAAGLLVALLRWAPPLVAGAVGPG